MLCSPFRAIFVFVPKIAKQLTSCCTAFLDIVLKAPVTTAQPMTFIDIFSLFIRENKT